MQLLIGIIKVVEKSHSGVAEAGSFLGTTEDSWQFVSDRPRPYVGK
jgi:hypothetical protein